MEAKPEGRIWKLVLSYDGTDFDGWQVQPGRRTVQGEISAAIERICGERVLPQGSGRTDRGVHALAQVASFRLSAPIPEENLARALNRRLPAAIRVLDARHMPEGFHARHSARGKTYEYRIFRGRLCQPWLARYVYAFEQRLDTESMQRASELVLGEHDFTSFAASDPEASERGTDGERGTAEGRATAGLLTGALTAAEVDVGSNNNRRTIYESLWTHQWAGDRSSDSLLVYRVRGNGFLHHMVRNFVGTFLEVGRGNLAPEEISGILEARSRAKAGPTAPARGLFLVSVDY